MGKNRVTRRVRRNGELGSASGQAGYFAISGRRIVIEHGLAPAVAITVAIEGDRFVDHVPRVHPACVAPGYRFDVAAHALDLRRAHAVDQVGPGAKVDVKSESWLGLGTGHGMGGVGG